MPRATQVGVRRIRAARRRRGVHAAPLGQHRLRRISDAGARGRDGRRARIPESDGRRSRQPLARSASITTGLRLYDGAGFSVRNRIPPRVLTQAIRARPLQAEPTHDLPGLARRRRGSRERCDDRFTSAPGDRRGARQDRLAHRGDGAGGRRLTADGRPLVFAVLADGMPYGQERPQAAIDAFADALAECGCRA